MRKIPLSIFLAASLAVATPVAAQTDFGDIISGVAKSLIAQELDRTAYLEAQRLNTASAYRNYLAQHPKGTFRTNAENALAKLGATSEPVSPTPPSTVVKSAASVEASARLTRTQRVRIQTQLTSLGYASGVADGLWGSNTRGAISRWQTANKLSATGYVTAEQVRLIGEQAGPGTVADTDETVRGEDLVEERLLGLTSDERREIQRRLTLLGYNTRGIDGSFGRNTRRALASWQRDEGLRASGYVTADQLRELRFQTAG